MREEAITLDQLFQEELDAVLDMLDALVQIQTDSDPFSEHYYSVTNEIVKLEQTALYLADRLADRVPCSHLRER